MLHYGRAPGSMKDCSSKKAAVRICCGVDYSLGWNGLPASDMLRNIDYTGVQTVFSTPLI